MTQRSERLAEGAAEFAWWLACFVALPLAADLPDLLRGASAFTEPKAIVLGSALMIGVTVLALRYYRVSGAAMLSRWAELDRRAVRTTVAFALLGVFVAASGLWVGVGSAPVRLLGSLGRFEGTLVHGALLLIAALACWITLEARLPLRLPIALFQVGASLAATVALALALFPGILAPLLGVPTREVAMLGTIGNAGLLGAYMAVAGVCAFSRFVGLGRTPLTSQVWHMGHLFLVGTVCVLAVNRASMGAGLVSLALVSIVSLWSPGELRRRRHVATRVLIAGCVIGAAILAGTTVQRTAEVGSRPAAEFQRSASDLGLRWRLWRAGIGLIREAPWRGHGPLGVQNHIWSTMPIEDVRLLAADLGYTPPDGTLRGVTDSGLLVFAVNGHSGPYVHEGGLDRVHQYALDIAASYGIPVAVFWSTLAVVSVAFVLTTWDPVARSVAWTLVCFVGFGVFWFPSLLLDPMMYALAGFGLGVRGSHVRGGHQRPI